MRVGHPNLFAETGNFDYRRFFPNCRGRLGAAQQSIEEIFSLIFKRRNFAGSLIGGINETQEMLDFCAEHNITVDVEVIPIQKINEAYERMLRSDVKHRFSIDMSSLSRAA